MSDHAAEPLYLRFFCEACWKAKVRAARRESSFTILSLTLVAPWRPHAPLTGTNAEGCSSMKDCCWSGGSLTMAQVERGEDFAVRAKIGVVHVRLFDGAGKAESDLAEIFGGHFIRAGLSGMSPSTRRTILVWGVSD